jgi:aspartyl-tRNA(Asn)/glutamyl-tRNA(Gln) amidotransferase subunit A
VRAWELSIVEAIGAFDAGDLLPVELTEAVLERIGATDGSIGAYAFVATRSARAAARAATEELRAGRRRSPLHGIPVSVKDNIDVAGMLTRAGSAGFCRAPTSDSTVAARLRAGGAVLVGKTRTAEFAQTASTPGTRNPVAPGRTVGGSSGGAAAAVAAGMAPLGVGTDTGGSVRIPASFCGVVGFRPTHGRVPLDGVLPVSWSLDAAGPITRTVADAALATATLFREGPSTGLAESGPSLSELTAGVAVGVLARQCDPAIASSINAALALLRRAGLGMREVEPPLLAEIPAMSSLIALAETATYHRSTLRESADRIGAAVRGKYEAGQTVTAVDYLTAQRARAVARRRWLEMFRDVDVLILPTVAVPPASDGTEFASLSGVSVPVTSAYAQLNYPANLLGLPALSVPCGTTDSGIPVGLQMVGRPMSDSVVLGIGIEYERLAQ